MDCQIVSASKSPPGTFNVTRGRVSGTLWGAVAFTGGFIGPPGIDVDYDGYLEGTLIPFSSGDPDPHFPRQRVADSAWELKRMGANVDSRRYPGMPHTILREEGEAARKLGVAFTGSEVR